VTNSPLHNAYVPFPVRVAAVTIENESRDLKSFRFEFLQPDHARAFDYAPGQFAEISILGVGECPIGIASSPTEGDHLLFTVKKVGLVTTALHECEVGATIGVRGPLGSPFPWDRLQGRNLVIVGGGFAFTTLRSAIQYILEPDRRDRFGSLTVVYGARSPGELLYRDDLAAWGVRDDVDLHVTVDAGDDSWRGHVGFVPTVLSQVAPGADNAMILVCGPPLMLKYTLPVVEQLGFGADDTVLSLENRMKCGIGKCGRCNVGHRYVCLDGPVFTKAELDRLPAEY
jgi:sulfhydrogenase subunit gamma (sulfur reductase)